MARKREREFDPRPVTPEVVPDDDRPKKSVSLMEALERCSNISFRKKMIRSLQEFDLAHMNSWNDVAKGYQVIYALYAAVGHESEGIRRAIDGMGKALKGFSEAKKFHFETEAPQDLVNQMMDFLKERDAALLKLLERYLEPDEMAEVKALMEQAYGASCD